MVWAASLKITIARQQSKFTGATLVDQWGRSPRKNRFDPGELAAGGRRV